MLRLATLLRCRLHRFHNIQSDFPNFFLFGGLKCEKLVKNVVKVTNKGSGTYFSERSEQIVPILVNLHPKSGWWKSSTSNGTQTKQKHFFQFFAIFSFSAFYNKNVKKHISTSVWCAQHSNTGWNIQHTGFLTRDHARFWAPLVIMILWSNIILEL